MICYLATHPESPATVAVDALSLDAARQIAAREFAVELSRSAESVRDQIVLSQVGVCHE